ncbi:adenylate/guanylate cyclase domain-containing protein [Marimonas sp. MJW-29]|uniref:Adenylate/guanylate cyclase domain-containing protein n=1 Tax=Sulfitobacter sediminis TaxID=3234186 RepID=A0ABV3RTV1_9RHOB
METTISLSHRFLTGRFFMHRQLAAILCGDMVGYSRLMAIDEAGTLRRLKRLRREIIDPNIAEAGGKIIKLTGDGMLVVFNSVVDAVEAAASVQRSITSIETASSPEDRIAFRIGLHLGDVILDEGDVYGDGVNVAARLESEADPGGVTLSDAVFQQVRAKTDLSFLDLGKFTLKNIPGLVHAHKVDFGMPGDNVLEALTGAKPDIPETPSVAVLPFDNMSGDAEQTYFADGITEDIITELSRFPELMVIARNSTFAYKGRAVDIRGVSRDLGVRFVVEGSVRRAGNRIRVTAQLIEATTGSHLWAERYDRDLEDIFEVQEEITRGIVASIIPQIEHAEIGRVLSGRDIDFSSYDLALKAFAEAYEALRLGSYELLTEASETAASAIERDRRCALAYAVRAQAFLYIFLFRWGDNPDGALVEANTCIEQLFDIGTNDPRAYAMRGTIQHFSGNRDEGLGDLRRAVELNPNYAYGFFLLAWAESLDGYSDEATKHAKLGLRLSPRERDSFIGIAYLALAQASFSKEDDAETQKWARLAIQMHPRAPIRRALMVATCGLTKDMDEAREHRDFLASFAPDFLASLKSGKVSLYKNAKDNARLIDGLERALAFSN